MSRRPSASKCAAGSRVAPRSTNRPFNLPAYEAASAIESIFTRIASPFTRPLVLGDHARGTALTMNALGDVAWMANRSLTQPRPNGPHISKWGLASPHVLNWASVQSPAFFVIGDPVSRGPCTSVSQLMMSIT